MKNQTKKSGVLHFTIGNEFGILLMNIAQEHLIYSYDPEKAIRSITDSLMGCPEELALQILKGDMVLPVDEETQQVICRTREPEHGNLFPMIDVDYQLKRMHNDIIRNGNYLRTGLFELQNKISKNEGKFRIDFDYDQIFKFIAGNDDVILDELEVNEEVQSIEQLFSVTKKYIETTMKIKSIMEWIYKTWGGDYSELVEECSEMLIEIMSTLKETLNLDFPYKVIENDAVINYIEAVKEIDIIISKGIEPVNIMDNWSAGWLSPEGDYYALNGEIGNMLHIQIADALKEKGIIPLYEDDEDTKVYREEVNPYAWLEQHGWVNIHENNVQFAGNLNVRLDKPIVHITTKQLEVIDEYIRGCHQCEIKVGWRRERQSIGMFMGIAMKDLTILYKRYFDF
jgi:hypothetical protein